MKSDFVSATKQIAAELGINVRNISCDLKYERNSDFTWQSFSDEKTSAIPGFTLSLDLTYHWGDNGTLEPSVLLILDINYEEHAQPFELEYTFPKAQNYLRIAGWVSWALHSFNLKYHPLNLENKFGDNSIRVYGLPKRRLETLTELYFLMKGLQASEHDVVVLKLRHVDPVDWFRSYSYAIWAEKYSGLWIFFCDVSDLDSGGGRRDFAIIEKLIASLGKKVTVTTHDVSLPVLESFLLKFGRSINSFDSNFSLQSLHNSELDDVEAVFGQAISENLKKANESFWNRDYGGALRDLRAVVQDVLELVAKMEAIDLSSISNPNVNKIAGKLIEGEALDGRLKAWFESFTSFANVASHKGFPSDEDWKDIVTRARVLATFTTGRQLLVEMKHRLMNKEKNF